MLVEMIDHAEMFKDGSQKGCCSSELESSMSGVQIEQNSYEMPPRDGFTITLFITVADINRSADFYETVFGGRILSRVQQSRFALA